MSGFNPKSLLHTVDPGLLQQLVEQGLGEADARAALEAAGGNGDAALMYAVSCTDEGTTASQHAARFKAKLSRWCAPQAYFFLSGHSGRAGVFRALLSLWPEWQGGAA